MVPHLRMAQYAIAAVSRLAELYDETGTRHASSIQIARDRNLPKPIVAKILTILAQADLVIGSPGPRGGYRLARPPASISLWHVAELFHRDYDTICPFGPGWCGNGNPCPLHDDIARLQTLADGYLRDTHFDVFQSKTKDLAPKRGAPP